MRTILITLTAAGMCAMAAVAVSGVPQLKGSAPVKFTLPATPDSLMKGDNPFKKESLLGSMPAISPLKAEQIMADYTTLVPDTAGHYFLAAPANPGEVSLQRFVTGIRPSGFFKGKLKISTHAAAKGFVGGEEVINKTSFDTIPEPAEGAFTLEPGRDAIIEVRTLADTTSSAPSLTVEIIPDDDCKEVELSIATDQRTRFNINTIAEGKRLYGATLSPDGAYLLLAYSYSANSIDTEYSYAVMATDSRRLIAENLPEGCDWITGADSRLQYPRGNGDGTYDIVAIDLPSMKQTVIASSLPDSSKPYALSPNADYIIYYDKKDGAADNTGVMHRIQSPDDRQPGNRDRNYISMIRLADGIARPLTYGGSSTYITDMSDDGSKLLYYTSRETPDKFPFYETKLIQLDVNTLATDTIAGVDSSINGAIYSPDSRKIFITAGPNAFGGIGLNAGDHEWGNDFDIQGYLYNLDDSSVKPLTRDFDPSIMDAEWNQADGLIYLRGEEGFDANLFPLDPKTGKITHLNTDVDFTTRFSIASRRANWLAYTGMSYTYMGRGYLMNLKSGKSTLIDDPMAKTLEAMEFGKWEPWTFTAPDGSLIDGSMTLPPDFDPNKKYPLIVYYYGGTSPSCHVNHHPYTPQLMASRGYVVYVLNPSGTTGYGQEFSARHVNAWGDRTADEIIYGVKEFCKAHPFVDDKKIGCLGASYGGFMTQLLQTKTDIFAAAVSHAGISDITSYWGEGFWGYTYNSVAAARSYPWNNPKLFTEHSPLFNADKIHTPLLLLHGTVDTNVPIGESIQLYNALKILGRDVEFITVEGSDHVVVDFQKRKEWHATIMAWFEKWLKDDSRWWDSIYDNK